MRLLLAPLLLGGALLNATVSSEAEVEAGVGSDRAASVEILEPLENAVVVEGQPLLVRLGLGGSAPNAAATLAAAAALPSLCFGLRLDDDGTDFGVNPDQEALRCEEHLVVQTPSFSSSSFSSSSSDNGTGIASQVMAATTAWAAVPALRLGQVPLGRHAAWAVLRYHSPGGAAGAAVVAVRRFAVVPGQLEPSYAWQDVHEGQTIPEGLEVVLDLSHSHLRRARIPPVWRLQVWVEEARSFLRMDVAAHTQVREVTAAAAVKAGGVDPACVTLTENHHGRGAERVAASPPPPLESDATAEEAGLFALRSNLAFAFDRACMGLT